MTSRRMALSVALIAVATTARGDVVIDFSDLPAPTIAAPAGSTGAYENGQNLSGGFTSGGAFFNNSYDPTYGDWSGWAYSNVNDPAKSYTPPDADYNHQYAAITGTAPGGSGTYAISYGGYNNGVPSAYINLPAGTSPVSFDVTNTTYDYMSMSQGDGFAKKFGPGDDFELKVFGYSGPGGGGTEVGEVDFYLANFLAGNSLIVNAWTLVDLSSLKGAESLAFDYASSDVGMFGINTPESFAMDDLTLSAAAVPEPSSLALAVAGAGIAGLFAIRRRRSIAAR